LSFNIVTEGNSFGYLFPRSTDFTKDCDFNKRWPIRQQSAFPFHVTKNLGNGVHHIPTQFKHCMVVQRTSTISQNKTNS